MSHLIRAAAIALCLLAVPAVLAGCPMGAPGPLPTSASPVGTPTPPPPSSLDAVKAALTRQLETPFRSELSLKVERLALQQTPTADVYTYLALVRHAEGFPPPQVSYMAESGTFTWSKQALDSRLQVPAAPIASPSPDPGPSTGATTP
jgi:hypothetical protein